MRWHCTQKEAMYPRLEETSTNASWRCAVRYKVNVKKTDEGYAVWCPGLPGCWSQGETEEEALENIKDAIQAYLQTVEELSESKESRYVEVG